MLGSLRGMARHCPYGIWCRTVVAGTGPVAYRGQIKRVGSVLEIRGLRVTIVANHSRYNHTQSAALLLDLMYFMIHSWYQCEFLRVPSY